MVGGLKVTCGDYAVHVAVGPRAGRLGPVSERFRDGRVAMAYGSAQGHEHRVRGARVPRVGRVSGQGITLDDTQRHAQQFVTGAARGGHGVTGPLQRRLGLVRLATARHHQIL